MIIAPTGYDPYGNVLSQNGNAPSVYGFTGEQGGRFNVSASALLFVLPIEAAKRPFKRQELIHMRKRHAEWVLYRKSLYVIIRFPSQKVCKETAQVQTPNGSVFYSILSYSN